MKQMKKLKLLLPALAVVIALMASAFTYSPKHAAIVTSYFANESHATAVPPIGNTVPSGYTRITTAVIPIGLTAYENSHCPSPTTLTCLVVATGNSGDPQIDFTITAVKQGTWQ
jgi:hypothetical protein